MNTKPGAPRGPLVISGEPMTQDRRLIAHLVIQFLKENEDMSLNGDLMTCLRWETKWRKEPENATKILPAMYNYHESRIYEVTKLVEKVLETIDNCIKK